MMGRTDIVKNDISFSLKFELTRTTHPIVLGGEAIKVGFLPRTDSKAGDSFY